MAWRNVGIVAVSVVTVSVALVWGYSVFESRSNGSVEIQPVEAPAWQVEVEDLAALEGEEAAEFASVAPQQSD